MSEQTYGPLPWGPSPLYRLECVCGWATTCTIAAHVPLLDAARDKHMATCPECVGPTSPPRRPVLDAESERTYDAHTKAELWQALTWLIWSRTVGETTTTQECADRTLERLRTALGQVRER